MPLHMNRNARSRLLVFLAVLLCLFTFSSQRRQLPQNYALHTDASGAPSAALYAVTGIVFQVVESSREAGGLRSTETVREKETRGMLCLRAALLFALPTCLSIFRLTPPQIRGRAFPFENGTIHSRRIILRFIRRKDGRKRVFC